MNIHKKDIEEYIINNFNSYKHNSITLFNDLYDLYQITDEDLNEKYLIQNISNHYLEECIENEKKYNRRRKQLNELKKLKLPDQRTPEWYALRKKILTASSLGSAIGKCHFQSREELLYSKIEDVPYVGNEITEWGVKYEDVAIQFYEELYHVKVLDFGLIPHPTFTIFGASPDGICDDTGNLEYLGRMVEIKCPPKRKFTKSVPEHYGMQVQGQLEVCDLDECDFFQVKIEEYGNYDEYCKDFFEIDGSILPGRTKLNYPKGVTITYKIDEKLSYKYCQFNQTQEQYKEWIESQEQNNIHEIKWWKIERYECTLVIRNHEWWLSNIENILLFYKDLEYYKKDNHCDQLKEKIKLQKTKKKRFEIKPLENFLLESDSDNE